MIETHLLQSSEIERTVLEAVAASSGHFVYESGHHGDLWLTLDKLFVKPRRTQRWAAALAAQAMGCRSEFVCGSLTGGAFIAQLLAVEMRVGFVFTERLVSETTLVQYRLPAPLRELVSGRRVLIVDDAVNAGSALNSTLAELLACGAEPAGFASLLTLGDTLPRIAQQHGLPFFTLVSLQRGLWPSEECPLCRSGMPAINHLT